MCLPSPLSLRAQETFLQWDQFRRFYNFLMADNMKKIILSHRYHCCPAINFSTLCAFCFQSLKSLIDMFSVWGEIFMVFAKDSDFIRQPSQ